MSSPPEKDFQQTWSAQSPPAAENAGPTPSVLPTLLLNESPVDRELQPLLRRRLLVLVSLAVWGLGSYVAGRLTNLPQLMANEYLWLLFAIPAAALTVNVGILILVIWKTSTRVITLRIYEFFAVAAVCGHAIAQTIDPIPAFMLVPEATTYGANNDILLWFAIITLYGVLVPNTLRRAICMTGALLVAAAGSTLFAWSRYDLSLSMRALWVTNLVVFLGIATGMSVFNSARLDSYRREAAEARNLGQYRLGRKIGRGGMGEVYLAEHRLLKRACAVKLIRPDISDKDTSIKRFAREVAAATKLSHPANVQVYDYGQAQDGTFYYVMEYLHGRTLEETVRQSGAFPPGRVIHVLRQICGALNEAHALGLIHRDVKPGNIILCKLGGKPDVAKLLDFGLVVHVSRPDTRITQAHGVLGTPAYMSPEQARGAEDIGPATDLYSLGAVGFFLLTGQPPFPGSNTLELLHSHLTAQVVPPSVHNPDTPRDLETILLRLLAKAPGDRYSSASEMDSALAKCESASGWTNKDASAWWDRNPVRSTDG